MNGERCTRNHCTGTLEDGYCDVCGLAAIAASGTRPQASARVTARSAPVTTGTGSSPLTRASKGSRRTHSTSARSTRRQLGAGLISIPELPSTEPEKAILIEAKVPENKRACGNCNNPLKREKGFCSKCGQKYSFVATLQPGDVIAGQYEVKGAIAYGGLGWIYLGFDKTLSRYVVLKGLLNSEDAASAAVAVAERQFLAVVKHPNIVGIYNFVNHGTEGFIIMEYVGGKTIQSIRQQHGPLPVEEAISYIMGILPAFSYMHERGLVYCDFKPDNFMLEEDDVKLIDMGGVRRINDVNGDIFGTRGYMAPEAADNPIEVSDLYTIGRSLATLIMDFKYMTDFEHSLPTPAEQPVLAQNEALYRFLLRSTHNDPDQRFQSAEEMSDQLFGVLREIVALKSTPKPAESKAFNYDNLIDADDVEGTKLPAPRLLPALKVDATDPASNNLMRLVGVADTKKRVAMLLEIVNTYGDKSIEARLLYADTLLSLGEYEQANKLLDTIAAEDEFDWRVSWYRGKSFLAAGDAKSAKNEFDKVYFMMPGEVAPKLAIGFAAEQSRDIPLATAFYERVAKTDPNNTTAVFGLARCLEEKQDFAGAATALEMVPPNHSLYPQSRVALANVLMHDGTAMNDTQLDKAAQTIESISTEGGILHQLGAKLLSSAVWMLSHGKINANASRTLLGNPVEEYNLRTGAESEYRKAAKYAADTPEKIAFVDRANEIRPTTLL